MASVRTDKGQEEWKTILRPELRILWPLSLYLTGLRAPLSYSWSGDVVPIKKHRLGAYKAPALIYYVYYSVPIVCPASVPYPTPPHLAIWTSLPSRLRRRPRGHPPPSNSPPGTSPPSLARAWPISYYLIPYRSARRWGCFPPSATVTFTGRQSE